MNTTTLLRGDCRELLASLPEASVDAIVTDPPYHLTTGKKGGTGEASVNLDSPYGRARIGTGFMGMTWDGGDVAFQVETWRAALRVLKPGGHLLAFSGTRTYHRMVCAIEDAGFEVRDQLAWVYGSGFPKSRSIAADMPQELAEQWDGWGTACKPAWEPICMARKPLQKGLTIAENVLRWGTGALNIDACSVPTEGGSPAEARRASARESGNVPRDAGERSGAQRASIVDRTTPERYMEARAGEALGRWPANLIHDGSDEVIAAFPQAKGQQGAVTGDEPSQKTTNAFGEFAGRAPAAPRGDEGSAARFFYCAKASKSDRGEGNTHPTVKPTELMRHLCRLVTPPGGVVLDPFMGSGSTGKAAMLEGFSFIGCELSEEYLAIARARIDAARPKPPAPASVSRPLQLDLLAPQES
jgi:site-specific DNA-methyltransferase (adenine-specific)